VKHGIVKMIQQRVNHSWLSGILDVSRSSMNRWQKHGPKPKISRIAPNGLSSSERQQILDLLHSEEFVEDTPYQVVSKLLDRGEWLCSVSSMYRVLSDSREVQDRRNQRRHPKYEKPIIQATAPRQLWCWDITRLPAEIKGKYYFLYVMIDVFSRYVVGWMVTHEENSDRAQHFIRETIRQQGIVETEQLTIHSDRGSPTIPQISTPSNNEEAERIKVIDPTHPLFGRVFEVVSVTRQPNSIGYVFVRYQSDILLRIPIPATTLSSVALPTIATKLNISAIEDLLDVAKECEGLCSSSRSKSGRSLITKSDRKLSKTSRPSLKR
jgi:transposase-like protein